MKLGRKCSIIMFILIVPGNKVYTLQKPNPSSVVVTKTQMDCRNNSKSQMDYTINKSETLCIAMVT